MPYIDENDTSESIDITRLYLDEIGKHSLLSNEETIELIRKAQNGDIEARNKIMEHNLKLVVNIARKHCGQGIPFLDLIEYGNLGIINAIKKFDLTSNTKFSTYLAIYIDCTIRVYKCKELSAVNYGRHVYYLIGKIKRYIYKFYITHGYEPTIEEIEETLNVKKRIVYLYKLIYESQLVISGNTLLYSGEDECTLFDIIGEEDSHYTEILEMLSHNKLIDDICNSKLDERRKFIILYRYGFIDGKIHTLEEIGQKYDISRERVRQLEASAFKILRKKIKR